MYKHCIIGGGPVGLTLALLFKQHKIPFILIERRRQLSPHPSAHYINMRTREVFQEIDNLDQQIANATEPIQNFKYYTYIKRIGEQELFRTNQLDNQMKDLEKHSSQIPTHLPQNILVQTLLKNLQTNLSDSSILLGHQVSQISQNGDSFNIETTNQEGLKSVLQSQYVYGCDGLNGFTRQWLGIGMVGQSEIQNFINVHFQSHQLMKIIAQTQSMLTFIYNSDIVAVLIAHQISSGSFSLQIPLDMLLPSYSKQDFQKIDHQKIRTMLQHSTNTQINDIEIKSVGLWKMGSVVANQYIKGRAILLGDSAHSVPPAGGFGMNTGIQDAHNLAHKIKHLHNEQYNRQLETLLFDSYERERKHVAYENMTVANRYYQMSLDIASAIGYNYRLLQAYKGVYNQLAPILNQFNLKSIYQQGLKYGSLALDTGFVQEQAMKNLASLNKQKPGLIPLIFPEQETGFRYPINGYLDHAHGVEQYLIGKLVPNWKISPDKRLRQFIIEEKQSNWRVIKFKQEIDTETKINQLSQRIDFLKTLKFQHHTFKLEQQEELPSNIDNLIFIVRPDLHIFSVQDGRSY